MLRALGLRRSEPSLSDAAQAPLILKQAHDFELSLQAMDFLLDDRTDEGLHLINDDPDSTVKTLANGVILFLEATLGFELEVMKKANEVLNKTEQMSSRDRAKHQKMKLKASGSFPPGTVYAVMYAEASLLNALIMLLSESMIESAKALLKLRKAYQTLDEILVLIKEHESKQKQQQSSQASISGTPLPQSRLGTPTIGSVVSSSNSSFVSANASSMNTATTRSHDVPFNLSQEVLSNSKLIDLADKIQSMRISRLEGSHIGNSPASDRLRTTVGMSVTDELDEDTKDAVDRTMAERVADTQGTIDEFIISGTNLCFGILQLVLSLIPPAIGKVLSVVGFKGDKENGLRMIWKSVQGRNIHGCIGLLGLLVFYDGPFQFTDADFDIPDTLARAGTFSSQMHQYGGDDSLDDVDLVLKKTRSRKIMDAEAKAYQGTGKPTLLHPGKKLEDALLYARALFPHSALWLLQEARMLAARGRLEESLQLMDSLDRDIRMKQVEALLRFDRTMILIFLHKYERAADEIIKLIDINAWSPGLYTYTAGCCFVELYRMCNMGLITNPEELKRQEYFKKKATELINKAPTYLKGVGRLTTKTMPFDKFVLRKIAQFETSAKQNKCDLADAVGVSPTHELMYFWNGYNRMPEAHLHIAKQLLGYSVSEHAKFAEDESQAMIRHLLSSITLRRLGKVDEGLEELDKHVVSKIVTLQPENKRESYKFTHLQDDPWVYPTALYERALFEWKLRGVDGLGEARQWLRYAQEFSEDYELSTRVGMKIKAACDRLDSM